jgi:general secretion pathway protein A
MVLNYYQLAEQPFGVTPDPRFLYLSATHREAMASVLYGVKAGRGFTALIAEPGMGKTTVLFNLLQQLGETAKTAFLFQSHDTPRNFLRNLLLDLGVEDDGEDLYRMQVKLNECLVRETSQGKHFVVVVDESQNLDAPVLEVVRMLSNFETPREKLMHIILAGQPQLATRLASQQMLQLRQRISIIARLAPFNIDETRAYIDHRLRVAGYRDEQPLFTDRAYALIAEYSAGIPRNINNICFNALSLGCAMQRKTINAAIVEEVLRDLDLAPLSKSAPAALNLPAQIAPLQGNLLTRVTAFLPKQWKVRVGIAAVVAVLAGFGLTVLGKNQHVAATPAAAVSIAAASASPTLSTNAAATAATNSAPITASPDVAQPAVADGNPVNHQADAPTTPTVVADPTASRADSEVVRIEKQDTLYQICMNNLGRYDQQVLAMIRELNPGFDSPRHLHVGQEIRIPTPGSLMARTNLSVEPLGNTSAAEAKKP